MPKQEEILRAIAAGRKVAVRSGQKCGKSIVAVIAALWFVCCFPGAYVILTAPSGHQVKNVLWKELRRIYREAKIDIGGKMNLSPAGGLKFEDGRAIIGMSTDKPERMAGPSGANLFFIVDEASGFKDEIFDAVQGNTSGGGRIFMISNPTKSYGFFYQAFHRNRPYWKLFELTSIEASKYAHEFPGLFLPEDIAEKLASEGAESIWFKVRVMGEFPAQGENTIIRLDVLNAAAERWLERFEMKRDEVEALEKNVDARDRLRLNDIELGHLEFGVDVARFGDDDSVIVPRRGNVTGPKIIIHGFDSNEVAAAVVAAIKQHRVPHERAVVKVDGIGYGSGVVDRLRQPECKELCEVVDINVAERADDPEKFPNLRSQLWFGVAEWLSEGGEIAPDPRLESEFLAPTYSFDPTGRRVVQQKKEIKKTLGRSPDRADAVSLAVYRRHKPLRKAGPKASRGDASRLGDQRGYG